MDIIRIPTPSGEMAVSLALSFRERLVGLLGRPPLSEGEALLLRPCRGIHTWGMRYAIDVLFLAEDGRILAAHDRVLPWRTLQGPRGAVMTLELPSGILARGGPNTLARSMRRLAGRMPRSGG